MLGPKTRGWGSGHSKPWSCVTASWLICAQQTAGRPGLLCFSGLRSVWMWRWQHAGHFQCCQLKPTRALIELGSAYKMKKVEQYLIRPCFRRNVGIIMCTKKYILVKNYDKYIFKLQNCIMNMSLLPAHVGELPSLMSWPLRDILMSPWPVRLFTGCPLPICQSELVSNLTAHAHGDERHSSLWYLERETVETCPTKLHACKKLQ